MWDTHHPAPLVMAQELARGPALSEDNESWGLWLYSPGKMHFLLGWPHERMWSHQIRRETGQMGRLVPPLESQPHLNSTVIKSSHFPIRSTQCLT